MIKLLSQEEMIERMLNNRANYAAIYARRSTLNENGSLDTQVANCTEYAYNKNLFIFKVYSEAISATANNINERTSLAAMMEDAKKGYFKNLIVTKRDRLARVFEDYIYIKKYLNKYGVSILFQNDIECSLPNDPMSNFIDNIIMAVADFEPKRIREKCADGLKRKKEAGIYTTTRTPTGFIDPPDTKIIKGRLCNNYEPIEEYIKPIENIFETFVNNHNIKSIPDLREVLISSKLIPEDFTNSTLRGIIWKPVYAGLMTIDENIVYSEGQLLDKSTDTELQLFSDYFKPCVNVTPFTDDKTWIAAVNKLNSFPKISRKKVVDTLFHNIVYCNHCNSILNLKSSGYRCSCKNASISLKDLKSWLLTYFNTSHITKDILLQYISLYEKSLANEKSTLGTKLKQTRITLKNNTDDFLDDNPEFDKSKLQDAISKLYEEEKFLTDYLTNLNEKISLLKVTKQDVTRLVNEICKVSIYDDNILKLFIEIFIEKVIIDGENIIFNTKGNSQRSCGNLLESFH